MGQAQLSVCQRANAAPIGALTAPPSTSVLKFKATLELCLIWRTFAAVAWPKIEVVRPDVIAIQSTFDTDKHHRAHVRRVARLLANYFTNRTVRLDDLAGVTI